MKKYYLYDNNKANFYLSGEKEELIYTDIYIEDVNHGDALFEKISSYQNGIIWVVTKDTYNEFFDKQGKAIDSGLTKEELERALTYMHCKYFQYLRFIQVPVVNTEEELNAVDRDYIYYRLYAKDWQKNIKIVPNVDGYPIDVEIFNQYYKLCKEVDDGLNRIYYQGKRLVRLNIYLTDGIQVNLGAGRLIQRKK